MGSSMPASLAIPRSITAAKARLGDLEAIATAAGWERAAIVYAFTEPDQGHGGRETASSSRLSCREFAALGIAGLRSKDSVARYHRAWAEAVEAGAAQPAKPGAKVKMPDLPFPPTDDLAGNYTPPERVAARISRDPVYAREVLRQPAVQREARQIIREEDDKWRQAFRDRPAPSVDEDVLDSIGDTMSRRGDVSRALADLTDAIDVAHGALLRLDPEDRTEFHDRVENVVGRVAMLAALAEGAPDDVSALDGER